MRALESWSIGVAIPARNEEELLPRCLDSVLLAKSYLQGRAAVDIALVVDKSTDQTLQFATKILQSGGTARIIDAGRVGEARALAAKLLLGRHRGSLSRFWIANTDADCCVPHTWLSDQLSLAEQGVEAFAGVISVDTFQEHGPEVPARFLSSYLIEPDGSHLHVHGANLGVRADMYLQAGGWKSLATAEDHDLWNRLLLIGARHLSTCHIKVQTSGRRVGRAPFGFADALAAHNRACV